MSAVPMPMPALLSVADFAALPEDQTVRFELQEGNLVMSPRPRADHQACALALAMQLVPHLPANLEVLLDIDVDLELTAPGRPGFVRAPDVVVANRAARARTRIEGGFVRASEVVMLIEVVSPGSRRTDGVIKLGEYAEAAVPHYWIVDLDGAVALRAYRLDRSAYREVGQFGGEMRVAEPFPVTLDLTGLAG